MKRAYETHERVPEAVVRDVLDGDPPFRRTDGRGQVKAAGERLARRHWDAFAQVQVRDDVAELAGRKHRHVGELNGVGLRCITRMNYYPSPSIPWRPHSKMILMNLLQLITTPIFT